MWPARAGTAPREGKALEGSSRYASGMEQGRKASGRHGTRAACAARTVERGKNPEDGTDGGVATLARRNGSRAGAVKKGAPDVVACVGARTPGEADPLAHERSGLAQAGPGRRRGVRAEAKSSGSAEEPNPMRGARGTLFHEPGTSRKTPSSVRTRGGAPEANKALLDMSTHSEGDGHLTRAGAGAGDRVRPTAAPIQSLWRGYERTATRRHPPG
jgi:hypothetical protein